MAHSLRSAVSYEVFRNKYLVGNLEETIRKTRILADINKQRRLSTQCEKIPVRLQNDKEYNVDKLEWKHSFQKFRENLKSSEFKNESVDSSYNSMLQDSIKVAAESRLKDQLYSSDYFKNNNLKLSRQGLYRNGGIEDIIDSYSLKELEDIIDSYLLKEIVADPIKLNGESGKIPVQLQKDKECDIIKLEWKRNLQKFRENLKSSKFNNELANSKYNSLLRHSIKTVVESRRKDKLYSSDNFSNESLEKSTPGLYENDGTDATEIEDSIDSNSLKEIENIIDTYSLKENVSEPNELYENHTNVESVEDLSYFNEIMNQNRINDDVKISTQGLHKNDSIDAREIEDIIDSYSLKENVSEPTELDETNRDLSVTDVIVASDVKVNTSRSKSYFNENMKQSRKKHLVFRFNSELKSYIQACIATNMIERACETLRYYVLRNNKFLSRGLHCFTEITDVDIYNSLMRALAKQGSTSQVMDYLEELSNQGLTPSMQTYAACLECLGREPWFDSNMVRAILKAMEDQGLDIKNLFQQCSFVLDEGDIVLQAIRKVLPDYSPNESPLTAYDNVLLTDLSSTEPQKNPFYGIISPQLLRGKLQEQLQREMGNELKVPSIVGTAQQTSEQNKMRQLYDHVLDKCRADLEKSFLNYVQKLEGKHSDYSVTDVYPYLKLAPASFYVNVMMDELVFIMQNCELYSSPLKFIKQKLGSKVEHLFHIKNKTDSRFKDKLEETYLQYLQELSSPTLSSSNCRQSWQNLLRERHKGPNLDGYSNKIPSRICRKIGDVLMDILINSAEFDCNILNKNQRSHLVPILYTVFRQHNFMLKEEVKPHNVSVRLSKSMLNPNISFSVSEMPMLVPPLPWQSTNNGGFLLTSSPFIRLTDDHQIQKQGLSELTQERLNPVLDSLNILGVCPWIVNKPVLDVIIKVFKSNGDKSLAVSPPPSQGPPWPKLTKDMDGESKDTIYRERLKVKQRRAEMYSLWCTDLYRLSIANYFRDEMFWFPHNLDFRGRTYPIPPHLSHLGNDLTRGILLFASGKPLGKNGLDWLKIHAVNLTGLKKRDSVRDRLKFANDHMADILDSADHPLDGSGWWKNSDDPWQTLACCMEIAKAERSPDPTQYISHLPVHQDGSCNGLQHYAALGRDQGGAMSVNLNPSDLPSDVYSDIAELVEKERKIDAKNNNQVAAILEGRISRKVIKQTVMTTVYGVTNYGAFNQILRQLQALPDFPEKHLRSASSYLVKKVFHCLGEKFTSANLIQKWFKTCAFAITDAGRPVQWETPLDFFVVQPYQKMIKSKAVQEKKFQKFTFDMLLKPDSFKQKNAFPPNYIHSLDSTHMMLTALYSFRSCITFVSVHDCFWTHPCDVEVMNRITREQFINLHQLPLLEQLSESFLRTYIDNLPSGSKICSPVEGVFKNIPHKGKFDIQKVSESTYFFS